jgi:hypothetical protein
LVGYLLDHGIGYRVVLASAGMLHVIAFIVILLMIPQFQPAVIERRLTCQGVQ